MDIEDQPKSEFKRIVELENFYKMQFKVKTGKVPGTTFADRHRLGELLKARSEEEIKMLIDHFLKMNDQWFKKLGYSLDCFFLNFNKVMLDVDKVKKTKGPQPMRMIQVMGYCRNIKCTNRFQVTVPMSLEGLDEKLCPTCEERF